MIDIDFKYDNIYLSDFGFMVCTFGNNGVETVSQGSEITFDLTPVGLGETHLLSSAKYDSCITAEFDICKNPEIANGLTDEDKYVTYDEERDISRWLNRKKMLPLMFLSEHYEGIIFNGSFNISKVVLGGRIIGFHLSFYSDKPFGYLDEKYKFSIIRSNEKKIIYDTSDEIGTSSIDMTLTLKRSGDLTIKNLFDERETVVKNCVSNEVLTFTNMQISTSNDEHAETIMNDFNYKFPMICNSYADRKNVYQFSLPCDVVIEYKSIRKVGV